MPIRGGNWNNGANAGVFYLNLNNPRSNSNTNIGGRPASGERQKRHAYGRDDSTPSKGRISLGHGKPEAEILNRRRVPVAMRGDRSLPPPFGVLIAAMAKTHNNLFPQIYDFEALYRGYIKARRGKRDRREVQQFELDLEGNLIVLQNELIYGTFKTGQYRRFSVYEPKERTVAALPFRDRVLHQAIVAVIEPIWERRFINDSYACRPGRGTHRGSDRVQAMLRRAKRQHDKVYVLKADIAKYFYSIDHGALKKLVRRRIRCRRTLGLIDSIIDSTAEPGDLCPVGLPIGNLTSQLFANIYLHELDEYVKHVLREKYYVRYMDDFCIISHDKAHLHRVRAQIEQFLWDRLRLKTNAKTQIFPVGTKFGRALDFLGYRIWPTHRRIRKSSISRITRTLKKLRGQYAKGEIDMHRVRASIVSWVAHASHADAFGLRRKLLGSFVFTRGSGQ